MRGDVVVFVRSALVSLALVLAACGGFAAPTDAADPGAAASTSPRPDAADGGATTTRLRPEGPDAPDFTLALGRGGEFTLSEVGTPVYMVFWAEW